MSARIPAIILAGGRASRMGGGDKALKPLAGRPLLSHVIERLGPQAGTIAINANGDPVRFDPFGLPVIADTRPDFPGPLAGILAGLEWAAPFRGTHLVSVAVDTPFFPENLVERLTAEIGRGEQRIVLASSSGKTHPVFGLWPLALRGDLAHFLATGTTYKVSAFVERREHAVVDFPTIGLSSGAFDPFFNVNTPEDLNRAEAIHWELTA
jgi:molybdopterin-guanine dinucleotide biosynthesis protein A